MGEIAILDHAQMLVTLFWGCGNFKTALAIGGGDGNLDRDVGAVVVAKYKAGSTMVVPAL